MESALRFLAKNILPEDSNTFYSFNVFIFYICIKHLRNILDHKAFLLHDECDFFYSQKIAFFRLKFAEK